MGKKETSECMSVRMCRTCLCAKRHTLFFFFGAGCLRLCRFCSISWTKRTRRGTERNMTITIIRDCRGHKHVYVQHRLMLFLNPCFLFCCQWFTFFFVFWKEQWDPFSLYFLLLLKYLSFSFPVLLSVITLYPCPECTFLSFVLTLLLAPSFPFLVIGLD